MILGSLQPDARRSVYGAAAEPAGRLRGRAKLLLDQPDLPVDLGHEPVDVDRPLTCLVLQLAQPVTAAAGLLAGELLALEDLPPARGLVRVLALQLLGDRLRLELAAAA
jgi:hypothetical protein